MAIQMAVPSHGGETLVTLIKDVDEKYCGPASNFLGLKCDGAGSMILRFEDVDGTASNTRIEVTTTDTVGTGVEMKRVCQAIAGAMAGYGTQGKYVKIADDLTDEFIHPDLLSVDVIA
jgi:hypothetical protein|tara:strand:+ start:1373 stop:1726 length:354 start_codon:yes stop_codon:yes gene_type:complete